MFPFLNTAWNAGNSPTILSPPFSSVSTQVLLGDRAGSSSSLVLTLPLRFFGMKSDFGGQMPGDGKVILPSVRREGGFQSTVFFGLWSLSV